MGLSEVDALREELRLRSKEREELMRKVKILTEKCQNATETLKREESEKHHERLIMKKTHETQLEIKNSLVRNLEDIIDEQEARIFNLQSHIAGIRSLSPKASKQLGGVTRLKNEIDELTAKNVELNEALMQEQYTNQKLNEEIAQLRDQATANENSKAHENGFLEKTIKYEDKILQLEGEKAAWKSSFEKLQMQLQKLQSDYGRLELENQRMDIKLGEMSLEHEKRERDLAETLAKEKTRYEIEMETLRKNCSDYTVQQNSEKAEVEAVEAKLENLRQTLTNAQNETNTLKTQLTDMEKLRIRSEVESNEQKDEIANLRAQISSKTNEAEEAENKHIQDMERLKNSLHRVRRESSNWQQRHVDAIISLDCFRASLRAVREELADLAKAAMSFPLDVQRKLSKVQTEILSRVAHSVTDLAERYKQEILLRKKYHNQLVELRGNIRVFARVRPILVSDEEQTSVVEYDDKDDAVLSIINNGRKQLFTLDKVFAPEHTQADIFQEVQSLIVSVLDGYNVCIFAYGQTGSGKTYTMEGPAHDPGINQRALSALFSEINTNRGDWNFKITVSMLEIYNETVRDLLCDEAECDKLDVKINPDGYLYVPGLICVEVSSLSEVKRVFQLGQDNRATASTNMNEHSSRSHALLCVQVVGVNRSTGVRTQGRLNLVDLAGSERVSKSAASGDRLKEAQCINKSLSALGDVIWALKNQHQHVPFRNSKLTYLLQDSLAGNSKTLMVVQVAPSASHVCETVCSLNFAQRVRAVELGAATKTVSQSSANGSNNSHDSSGDDNQTLTRSPSKNFKTRNGIKR